MLSESCKSYVFKQQPHTEKTQRESTPHTMNSWNIHKNWIEKVNNNKSSLAPLYKSKFVFWKNKNRKLVNIRPSLLFYGMIILVERSLRRNGMAAIPKNLFAGSCIFIVRFICTTFCSLFESNTLRFWVK